MRSSRLIGLRLPQHPGSADKCGWSWRRLPHKQNKRPNGEGVDGVSIVPMVPMV